MAGWNGAGQFNRLYSWVADAIAGIPIEASRMDADTDLITSQGFNNCLTRDGQGAATANLPMNGFKHTGVGNATGAGQYMTYAQVVGIYFPITGGTVAGNVAVTGNTTVGGTLGVTGTTTLGVVSVGSTLGVTGVATLSSNATVGGTLGVTGTTTLGVVSVVSTLGVSGATTLAAVTASGTTTLNGATQANGTFTAGVAATFNGSVNCNLTFHVGQTSQFDQNVIMLMDLNITGNCFANTFTPTSDGRVKTNARAITAEEGETWVRSVPPKIYQKNGQWEAGFFAQDINDAGFGDILDLIDDPAMPSEKNGSRGPEGKRWGVPLGSTDAYLAAALASALDKIEVLGRRLAALENNAKPGAL